MRTCFSWPRRSSPRGQRSVKESFGIFLRPLAAASISLGLISAANAAQVLVGAAASLTNAFKAIAQAYEASHPNVTVRVSFAASDVVLQQIINGAPVDVFASADQTAMDKAAAAHVIDVSTRKDFVQNEVVLIAPIQAGTAINNVADLKSSKVTRVTIGNPATVPVGRYTQAALQMSGDWAALESKLVNAQNVRQALDYVVRGEVDAGFVFGTDAVVAADKVRRVQSVATPQPVRYPIALTKRSNRSPEAQALQDFILSDQGQAILAKFGFKKP